MTEARANLREVFDQAEQGVSVPVQRAGRVSAVVDGERLRDTLALLISPSAEVFHEAGEWGGYIPSIPSISGTGDTLPELMADLVAAAREFAADWCDTLRHAPNHSENWGFVQVIMLSTDEYLAAWLAS